MAIAAATASHAEPPPDSRGSRVRWGPLPDASVSSSTSPDRHRPDCRIERERSHDSTRVHRRHVRPANVRSGPTAVRRGQAVHRRGGRAQHRGVLPTRRRPGRALGLRRRPARTAREDEEPGQGARVVELLPAQRRDRPGPVQPRLRLHRDGAREEPDRVRVPQLLGARHRQHGGARAVRNARTEGAVAAAPSQR